MLTRIFPIMAKRMPNLRKYLEHCADCCTARESWDLFYFPRLSARDRVEKQRDAEIEFFLIDYSLGDAISFSFATRTKLPIFWSREWRHKHSVITQAREAPNSKSNESSTFTTWLTNHHSHEAYWPPALP